MSPCAVSLLVALRDHRGHCCTPPVFVCKGALEVGGHGWALLYAPPVFVCEGALGRGHCTTWQTRGQQARATRER